MRSTKVKMEWPKCPTHEVSLVLRPGVQLGSPWACPFCGAIDISEDVKP